MTAAPRFCTVSRNAPCSHAVSVITSGTGLAVDARVREVGELRGRVVAPDRDVGDLAVLHAGLLRELRLGPVLVEAGHREPAVGRARRARSTARSGSSCCTGCRPRARARRSAAWSLIAWPWGLKIPPLTERRSPRSMPALRGIDPTSSAHDVPSNAVLRSAVASMPDEQRVRAVLQLHHHAFERGQRGLDLEQPQHDRLVGAEQLPAGDAVDERVADLARGAGDGDVERVRGHPRKLPGALRSGRSDHVEQQLARLGELGDALGRARCCPRRGRGARAAPGGGTAAARRRARWRCPAWSPSTSIAHRRSDGIPAHSSRRRPRRPDRRRRARRRRPHARAGPRSRRRTSRPSGSTPGRATRGVDEPERDRCVPTAGAAPPP